LYILASSELITSTNKLFAKEQAQVVTGARNDQNRLCFPPEDAFPIGSPTYCTDAFTSFMRQHSSSLFVHRFYQTPAEAYVRIDALWVRFPCPDRPPRTYNFLKPAWVIQHNAPLRLRNGASGEFSRSSHNPVQKHVFLPCSALSGRRARSCLTADI
jgi:hypothetical protein